MLDGENGRAKGKLEKILFQRSMGDHTLRCLQAVSADRHHVWLVQSIEPAALGWVRTVKADHFVSGGTLFNSERLFRCFIRLG